MILVSSFFGRGKINEAVRKARFILPGIVEATVASSKDKIRINVTNVLPTFFKLSEDRTLLEVRKSLEVSAICL